MPGAASLAAGEYYAHPRNAFWRLAADVFGIDPDLDYPGRCRALAGRGVGLWDTIARCDRKGSLDSDIRAGSEVPNDLAGWLEGHPLTAIGLNGGKAADVFRRRAPDALRERIRAEGIQVIRLPSSSPANATHSYDAKLRAWRALADGDRS